ncbi:MAG: hypothetical protein ACOC1Q_01925 [Desulfosalsimonas sp.]
MKDFAIAIGKQKALNKIFEEEGFASIEQAKEAAKKYAGGNLINLFIVECDHYDSASHDFDTELVAEGWHDASEMAAGEIKW